MSDDLTVAVYRVVASIPEGTVVTYGQIADRVGTGPRQVGRALHKIPRERQCPWQRVVNAQGKISNHSGEARQRQYLEAEGVEFDEHDRIDLNVFGWDLWELDSGSQRITGG